MLAADKNCRCALLKSVTTWDWEHEYNLDLLRSWYEGKVTEQSHEKFMALQRACSNTTNEVVVKLLSC